jgi:hypothetical protein
MEARQFFIDSKERIGRDGLEGVSDTFYALYEVFWHRIASRAYDSGVNIYDRDWDVLVVLDACRADLMASVAHEYEFIKEVGFVRSTGSATEQWLHNTFTPARYPEMARTTCVTGSPQTNGRLKASDFALLDEVWRYGWDERSKTVPAEPITDRAITHWRSNDCERMIVHYMQPHFPSVPRPTLQSETQSARPDSKWDLPWTRLRKGDLSRDIVWKAYRENLEYVLESVELLVNSIDVDRVVITADHGNSFGSWGLYGHPQAPIPVLRDVPWCELTARDTSGYEPTTEPDRDAPRPEVESMLRDLGYL